MNNQKYEQTKYECWLDTANFCGFSVRDDIKHSTFDAAFDRAYELGKEAESSERQNAEGEEMLTVSRKEVQERYVTNERLKDAFPKSDIYLASNTINVMLQDLFGPKCLPDEKIDPESLVTTIKDSMEHPVPDKMLLDGIGEQKPAEPLSQNSPENCNNAVHISTECDKTAELKFKAGNRVIYKNTGKVKVVVNITEDGRYVVASPDGKSPYFAQESDLEPYTEQDTSHETPVCENHSDNTSQKEVNVNSNRNLSQEIANCDKQFDTILKDGFAKERRLNIAAMAMQGIMANSNPQMVDMNVERVVDLAILTADTLIAECNSPIN